jgi:hypothetical protein
MGQAHPATVAELFLPREKGSLTLMDKARIAQKTFRLLCAEAFNVRADFITYTLESNPSTLLSYLGERAEQRQAAAQVNLRCYILEKEIGSEAARRNIETSFTEELL